MALPSMASRRHGRRRECLRSSRSTPTRRSGLLLVEFELDRVPAPGLLVTGVGADGIHERALVPFNDFVGEIEDRLGRLLAAAKRLHEDHGLLARLRE